MSEVRAGTNRWEPYPPGVGGPWGGNVRRLVSPDPATGVLWAATAGGVYHSTDGGDHWVSRSVGLESYDVTDIGVCAADPAVLIASTDDRGVHLSTDGGATWSRVPASAMAGYPTDFTRVAVDPGDCSLMFAASYNGPDKLYRSTDGGATWDDLGENPVSRLVFASRPAVGAWELFFSTRNGKVFRFGPDDTWPMWIHTFSTTSEIVELVVPGGDGRTLVAAQGGAGLWVGADGGNGWESPTAPGNNDTWDERFFRGAPNDDFLEVVTVASDPLDANRLLYHLNDPLAGAQTSLYASADLADTEVALPLPETGMDLQILFVTRHGEWLAESSAGLYRRSDRAGAFTHAAVGLAAFTARDFDFDGSGTGAWVSGGEIGGAGKAGLYLWDGSGGAWSRLSSGLPPGAGSLVRREGTDLWLGIGGGLYHSADDGATWTEKDTGVSVTIRHDLSDFALSVGTPSVAVLGTQGGVYHTIDAGASWSADPDLPATLGWSLAADVFGGVTGFYAAGNNGNDGRMFSTSDPSAGWTEVGGGVFDGIKLTALAASRDTDGLLFAGAQAQGAFESLDGGATWSPVGDGTNGFPLGGKASSVSLGPDGADLTRAAVVDGTVYVTSDGGSVWTHVDTGLLDGSGRVPVVLDLDFDPAGERVVAAVLGRGLWALDLVPAPDLAPPELVLTGANPVDVELDGAFVDPGAVATDLVLGDVAVTVDTSGLDTSVTGVHTVRYDACDADSNCATTQLRWVRVADTVGPVITLLGLDPLEWETGTPYLDPGATAFDTNDGDLTGSIMVDASGVDVDTLGVYPVTYNVTDLWGNPAETVTRSVQVVDTTPPVVTPVGADPYPWEVDVRPYVDPGAAAADALDGDLTASVVTDASAVDPGVPGDYVVTYQVSDGQGNVGTATRTVRVADTLAPTITLLGDNPLSFAVGAAYAEPGATALDAHDGDVSASITIDASGVDVSAAGTYQVEYRAVDAVGNEATAVRTVSVAERGSSGGGGGGGGCFLGALGGRSW